MKKLLTIFIMAMLALMSTACSDDISSPIEPSYDYSTPQSSHTKRLASSSSVATAVPTSQVQPVTTLQTTTTNQQSYWSLEVGYVCNGYNIDVSIKDKSKPVEGYMAMYQICGDRATQTYKCEPMESSVRHMVNIFNQATAMQVVDLAESYGAAFGFYDAVDGYLRYVYFEQCYDNKALMKHST